MRREDLYEAMSNFYPEYIEEVYEENKQKTYSSKLILTIICAVIGLLGITVYAVVTYDYGRGMNELQIDESQKQSLVEESAAIIYESVIDDSSLSVTSKGITVTPVSVIADERCAYISFKVTGYEFDERHDPCFERILVFKDNDEAKDLDYGGFFFNGLVDEGDASYYDDGSPIEYYDNGDIIEHYYDKDGNLHYLLVVSQRNIDEEMLGHTVNVRFEGISENYELDTTNVVDGAWSFALKLPTKSTSVHFDVNRPLTGTNLIVDSVEISPVSIRLNYTKDGVVESVPCFAGVILDDESKLMIGNDGLDISQSKKLYSNCYFSRVIDPQRVKSIIIYPNWRSTNDDIIVIPIK